jgi:hypothetical protein
MTQYKKLQDFELDWMKVYPKQFYEDIIKQMYPDHTTTKILVAGIKTVYKDQ